MFTTNPFVDISSIIDPTAMQVYVVVMVLFVIGGTILDMLHKKSAKYFFENAEKAKKSATRQVSGGEKMSLMIKTATHEVLTSGEFANPQRRLSHLLTMYGFILFVISTAVMIFSLPSGVTPTPLCPVLWHVGALMLAIGGYWFWFFIRVDVSAEGQPWYRFSGRGDLFIVSLITMATFALIWSILQSSGVAASLLFFGLFVLAATTLFTTVYWSKFAHMFFKPAAAYQKRITRADGSKENLPDLGDLTDPALQARYPDIPTYMGEKPPHMGLGIKNEAPQHY